MIQFTDEEIQHIRIRAKKKSRVIEQLKKQVHEIYHGDTLVPKTGIANWTLYYYCPDCSVALTFERKKPHQHQCPVCKKIFSGEPYDSAWWGMINGGNCNAVYDMAVLWLAGEEEGYARKAVDILTQYAQNYPDYEIHGDIPYNGPGRANAQTLDEAVFLRSFAMAYDILQDYMSEQERDLVKTNMLIPGAQFLLEHRHNQIHNHEVIINSAIAVIGILFGYKDYVETAVYGEYGIKYQLEHGMLPGGMWFEGSFGYHFYALASFFAFEKFALHTGYSMIHHPNYKAMLELPFSFLQPDMNVPMLNDTNYGHMGSRKYLYEFPYRELGGEKLAFMLNTAYEHSSRDHLEALLYGADEIEETKGKNVLCDFHGQTGSFGHSILRGEEGRYLLFKYDSYGGEHDHYDRLSLSWTAFGKMISRDLGTTGYGAKMHYDYYKNTATHNTMVIGEENQAPVNGKLTRCETIDGITYIEAEADWRAPFTMPDSFTIIQWKEENYRPVIMTRKIAWTGRYFAEMMICENAPENMSVDWIMHFSGNRVEKNPDRNVKILDKFSDKKPLSYLTDVSEKTVLENPIFIQYEDGGVFTDVYSWGKGQTCYFAEGPDNPSAKNIQYLIERDYGKKVVRAHIVDSWKEKPTVAGVTFREEKENLFIEITETSGEKKKISFSF